MELIGTDLHCIAGLRRITHQDGEVVVEDFWEQGDADFDARARCCRKNQYPFLVVLIEVT